MINAATPANCGAAAEVRLRVERLLERLKGGAVHIPDLARGHRLVEVLEQAGTPEARRLLEQAAKEAGDAALKQLAAAAVERLAKRPRP